MRALLFAPALLLAAPAAEAQSIDDLRWLEGCWRQANEHRSITEVWIAPPMPALLGYAFTLTEGEPSGWEQTRIALVDGVPSFVAMPEGGAPVAFALTESSSAHVVFENPAHDFPKRVEYRREGNVLDARVSAGEDGIDYRYRRIDCAAAHAE